MLAERRFATSSVKIGYEMASSTSRTMRFAPSAFETFTVLSIFAPLPRISLLRCRCACLRPAVVSGKCAAHPDGPSSHSLDFQFAEFAFAACDLLADVRRSHRDVGRAHALSD